MQSNSIIAFYPRGAGNLFSGQRIAAEILINGLIKKGRHISAVHTPVFNRVKETNNGSICFFYHILEVSLGLLILWLKCLSVALSRKIIYVNPGQSTYGLIRDGFPLLVRSWLHFEHLGIVSLHGSLFLKWENSFLETKLLQKITQPARYITILGPIHKAKLINLGIPEEKIIVMDNTCSLSPLSETAVLKKHQIRESLGKDKQQSIKILYLSFLMESKGYVDFIKAISYLAINGDIPIQATICGQIRIQDNNIFPNYSAAKSWLESQVALVNQSRCVRLQWVNGAAGEDKEKLFHEAQIFVLPSRFKVEAQPISIIEALASGCAVITTKVGEITTTVSEKTAILLDDSSPLAIAEAINELCNNLDKRRQLAWNAFKLFQERFSHDKHIERWEKLLNNF